MRKIQRKNIAETCFDNVSTCSLYHLHKKKPYSITMTVVVKFSYFINIVITTSVTRNILTKLAPYLTTKRL